MLLISLLFLDVFFNAYGFDPESPTSTWRGSGNHLFNFNPANGAIDERSIETIQSIKECHSQVIEAAITEREARVLCREKISGVAGNFPIGGAAVGAKLIVSRNKIAAFLTDSDKEINEFFIKKDFQFGFRAEITPLWIIGFLYHYRLIDETVFGNFFLSDSDYSRITGSLSGYRVGVMYDPGSWRFSAFNAGLLRGKAEVTGEQKLLNNGVRYGFELLLKWKHSSVLFNHEKLVHEIDESLADATSPIDQRKISLVGIDLEAFFFPGEVNTITWENRIVSFFAVGVLLSQATGNVIFNSEESKSIRNTGGLFVEIIGRQISISVGLLRQSQEIGKLTDSKRIFGFSEIEKASLSAKYSFLSIGIPLGL